MKTLEIRTTISPRSEKLIGVIQNSDKLNESEKKYLVRLIILSETDTTLLEACIFKNNGGLLIEESEVEDE